MNIYSVTETEAVLAAIQERVDSAGRLISNAAGEINKAYEILWGLPDEKLLEVLNYLGPLGVQHVFTTHESRGTQINEILEEFNISNKKEVVIGSGKPVKFNLETGLFEMNWPPEEESP